MAKGGPVISTGPAIASSRGGSPLGIRVGGIEGGRLISPAEARITNIFGPAITRSDQIGFNPRPGFESVRPVTPLNVPFPERGESKARSQVPPGVESKAPNLEPVKPRPEVRPGVTIIKTAERPLNPGTVEQVFARRLRANLVSLTIPGVRTEIITGIETATAAKTRVRLQVGSIPETSAKTAVGTAPKPEVKSGKPAMNIVRTGEGNHNPDNRTARGEERRRRYIGQDLKTNSLRLEALTSKFEQLNGSEDVVDGAVLARESGIGTARSLRSRLLEQRGYDQQVDGSQGEIDRRLVTTEHVSRGLIEKLVEDNSAVEATDRPPLRLATQEEVAKVLTPPNSPVTHIEPVIVEEVIEKLVETKEVKLLALAVQPMQVFGEAKINDIEKSEPFADVADNIIIFPPRLDMEEYINSDGQNNVFKRRQLVLGRVH